jgi:hypothetical protein
MGTLLPLCNEVKSLSQRKRRRSSTVITVVILFLFYLWNTSDPSGYGEGMPTRFHALLSKKDATGSLIGKPIDFCSVDLDRLSVYNLTRQFEYSQRYVQQTPLTAQRRLELQDGNNPADNLDGELFPLTSIIGAEQAVKVNNSMRVRLEQCSTDIVPLHVKHDIDTLAADMPEDMSHLLFGVASNAERLLEAKDHFGFWLGHTGAEIILAIPDSPFIPLLKYEYEQRGINVRIIVSDLDFLKTYFKLTVWLDEYKSANTKWVTIIDDDTVYFSLRRFNKMLEKYDAKGDWYIGAPSEDSWQMMRSGFFGFGGAGVTLSVPLLQKMLPFYDECLTYEKIEINDPELGGDLRLARCITRNTETRFTIEPDLHQVDLRGDVRGVLQGPVSANIRLCVLVVLIVKFVACSNQLASLPFPHVGWTRHPSICRQYAVLPGRLPLPALEIPFYKNKRGDTRGRTVHLGSSSWTFVRSLQRQDRSRIEEI